MSLSAVGATIALRSVDEPRPRREAVYGQGGEEMARSVRERARSFAW
jgi:hypothetical protein